MSKIKYAVIDIRLPNDGFGNRYLEIISQGDDMNDIKFAEVFRSNLLKNHPDWFHPQNLKVISYNDIR